MTHTLTDLEYTRLINELEDTQGMLRKYCDQCLELQKENAKLKSALKDIEGTVAGMVDSILDTHKTGTNKSHFKYEIIGLDAHLVEEH